MKKHPPDTTVIEETKKNNGALLHVKYWPSSTQCIIDSPSHAAMNWILAAGAFQSQSWCVHSPCIWYFACIFDVRLAEHAACDVCGVYNTHWNVCNTIECLSWMNCVCSFWSEVVNIDFEHKQNAYRARFFDWHNDPAGNVNQFLRTPIAWLVWAFSSLLPPLLLPFKRWAELLPLLSVSIGLAIGSHASFTMQMCNYIPLFKKCRWFIRKSNFIIYLFGLGCAIVWRTMNGDAPTRSRVHVNDFEIDICLLRMKRCSPVPPLWVSNLIFSTEHTHTLCFKLSATAHHIKIDLFDLSWWNLPNLLLSHTEYDMERRTISSPISPKKKWYAWKLLLKFRRMTLFRAICACSLTVRLSAIVWLSKQKRRRSEQDVMLNNFIDSLSFCFLSINFSQFQTIPSSYAREIKS